MTQTEADEQAEMFALLGGLSTPTPEDMAMVALLSNPDAGRVVLEKFLNVAEMAGWNPAVVMNPDTSEYAYAFVHASGEGGAILVSELSEDAAKAIEKMFRP